MCFRLSLVPRPSPLSAHYTRGGFCACRQLRTRTVTHAHDGPHAKPAPRIRNERLAGKAWERGYILSAGRLGSVGAGENGILAGSVCRVLQRGVESCEGQLVTVYDLCM